jgi:hypothetical protein
MKETKKENMAKLLQHKREMVESIHEKIIDNNDIAVSIVNPAEQETEEEIMPSFTEMKTEALIEAERKAAGQEKLRILAEKLLGRWELKDHTVGGKKYLDVFIKTRLKGADFQDGNYSCFYDFKGRICLKTLKITGNIMNEGEAVPYSYLVRLTISYRVADIGNIRIILESGYLHYSRGNDTPVIKDFEPDDKPSEMVFRFEGDSLVIIDKKEDDYKVLEKC